MASGRIRRLDEPDNTPAVEIRSQVKSTGVTQSNEPQSVEVNVHEEVIREGQDKIRRPDDDGIEIRARHAVNPKAWNDVKRGNE